MKCAGSVENSQAEGAKRESEQNKVSEGQRPDLLRLCRSLFFTPCELESHWRQVGRSVCFGGTGV